MAGPNSSSGGKAIHNWKPRVRPAWPSPPPCHMPRPACIHSTPRAGSVPLTFRAFRDVAQGGDTRVGVKPSLEGRTRMLGPIEKYEWLQNLAEVARAHQACGDSVRPA